jgi:hypothetical protein
MYLHGTAGIGLDTAIKYLRHTASGAAGTSLGTKFNYLHGAASIGLSTTAKYLRRTTSVAAGNDLGTTADKLPATHNEQLRPGHHDLVPARRRGHRPGHRDLVPARRRMQWSGHHN